jgi:hypothetical protein
VLFLDDLSANVYNDSAILLMWIISRILPFGLTSNEEYWLYET